MPSSDSTDSPESTQTENKDEKAQEGELTLPEFKSDLSEVIDAFKDMNERLHKVEIQLPESIDVSMASKFSELKHMLAIVLANHKKKPESVTLKHLMDVIRPYMRLQRYIKHLEETEAEQIKEIIEALKAKDSDTFIDFMGMTIVYERAMSDAVKGFKAAGDLLVIIGEVVAASWAAGNPVPGALIVLAQYNKIKQDFSQLADSFRGVAATIKTAGTYIANKYDCNSFTDLVKACAQKVKDMWQSMVKKVKNLWQYVTGKPEIKADLEAVTDSYEQLRGSQPNALFDSMMTSRIAHIPMMSDTSQNEMENTRKATPVRVKPKAQVKVKPKSATPTLTQRRRRAPTPLKIVPRPRVGYLY